MQLQVRFLFVVLGVGKSRNGRAARSAGRDAAVDTFAASKGPDRRRDIQALTTIISLDRMASNAAMVISAKSAIKVSAKRVSRLRLLKTRSQTYNI